MSTPNKTALITGASRGIGKAIALSLARAGFDIAVTARTVHEGEGRVNTPFAKDQRIVPVEGSIESTVAAVEALDRRALGIKLDILSTEDIDRAVEQVLERWQRIDVLVNNALYQGPGLMYPFADFSDQQFDDSLKGILFNQVYLTRRVLPQMSERGEGTIICMSSGAAIMPPPSHPEKGGWGFIYAAAKSGFHRIVEFIHLEYHDRGIRAFNIEPGFTFTESMQAMLAPGQQMGSSFKATAPSVTGDVAAWLCSSEESDRFSGKLISSPTFFEDQNITYSPSDQ